MCPVCDVLTWCVLLVCPATMFPWCPIKCPRCLIWCSTIVLTMCVPVWIKEWSSSLLRQIWKKVKISQPIRGQGGHLFFSIGPKNTNLVEDIEILLPVKFRWILFTGVSKKKSKMYQPIRDQSGHLVFLIGSKNTNLVEDVEILLSVKFRWIPISGFREEVENVKS